MDDRTGPPAITGVVIYFAVMSFLAIAVPSALEVKYQFFKIFFVENVTNIDCAEACDSPDEPDERSASLRSKRKARPLGWFDIYQRDHLLSLEEMERGRPAGFLLACIGLVGLVGSFMLKNRKKGGIALLTFFCWGGALAAGISILLSSAHAFGYTVAYDIPAIEFPPLAIAPWFDRFARFILIVAGMQPVATALFPLMLALVGRHLLNRDVTKAYLAS